MECCTAGVEAVRRRSVERCSLRAAGGARERGAPRDSNSGRVERKRMCVQRTAPTSVELRVTAEEGALGAKKRAIDHAGERGALRDISRERVWRE